MPKQTTHQNNILPNIPKLFYYHTHGLVNIKKNKNIILFMD